MKILLAVAIPLFFLLINFAGAFPSQIQNGDFSNALPQATPVCNYFINTSNNGKDCSLGTSSLNSLPVSWGVDTNISNTYFEGGTTPVFDSVKIISNNVVSGDSLYHSAPFAVLLWSTIAGGALHPDSFCSYNSNGVPSTALTCSGSSTFGNYTAEGFIKQTVNINKSGAILHYWVSTAFSVPNPNKINASSGQEAYTCAASTPLLPVGGGYPSNDCGISNPRYRVQIKRLFANGTANDTLNLVEDSAANGDPSEHGYQEKSLPINANAGDNVTIVFASVGLNFAPTTLSAIRLDDVSIEYPADTAAMATKFISDHETLTPVGIIAANAVNDSGLGFPYLGYDLDGFANRSFIQYFRISKNFSDFYKFDMNLTFATKGNGYTNENNFLCVSDYGACTVADGFPKDFWGYDSSGGIYNISSANIRNATFGGCTGTTSCSLEVFGYIPSNVTNVSFTYRGIIVGNEHEITVNISLDPGTISSRRNWKSPSCGGSCFPITQGNETWSYPWQLLFYNFSYNPSSQNLSFWVYNFRNSTSFYPSMNLSSGVGINNVFLFDSSGGSLASGSDTRTYARESTFDFSNIASDNSAVIGNSVIINRTSANNWFNQTKTVSQSKFILSVAGASAGCSNFCASTQACTQGTSGNVLCTVDPSTCLFTATPNSPTCGGTAPPSGPSPNGTQNTSSGSSFDVGDIAGSYRTPINTLFRPDFIWIMVPFVVIFAVEIYSMSRTGHALGLDFRIWLGFIASWVFIGTFLVAIIGTLAGILIIAALVLLIVGKTYQTVVGGGTG